MHDIRHFGVELWLIGIEGHYWNFPYCHINELALLDMVGKYQIKAIVKIRIGRNSLF